MTAQGAPLPISLSARAGPGGCADKPLQQSFRPAARTRRHLSLKVLKLQGEVQDVCVCDLGRSCGSQSQDQHSCECLQSSMRQVAAT